MAYTSVLFRVLAVNFLLTGCLFLSSAKEEGKDPLSNANKWKLVWQEEFDYTGFPDSTKWSYDTKGNEWNWGNNEAQFYTAYKKENAWVSGGTLKITARKEEEGGKHYTSARLMTKGKGDWLYGRFEIRAKLPEGRGTWPAIWMLPTHSEYGGWPKSGEIDIMENVGYDPHTIHGTSHTEKYNHSINTQRSGQINCPDCAEKFHLYALEWDESEYRIYLDDTLYFTFVNEGTGSDVWPYDKPFYLLLNLAVGGNWGGQKGIDDSLFPHTYEIDYVRVYQKQ